MKILWRSLAILSLLAALPMSTANCSTRYKASDTVYNQNEGEPGNYKYSLEHDGLTRTYQVHIPTGYDKTKATPLVIYLHGGTGNATSAFMDGLDKYSDKHGFIMAMPEGTGEVDRRGKLKASWNGGKWSTGECCGKADDVGFIKAVIEKLKSNLNIDAKRIYATGISNGGLMTNRLGCELSTQIAAIATVAPAAILSECKPKRAMPYLHIHGKKDRCNNFETGEAELIFCKRVPYTRMPAKEVVKVWHKLNACTSQMTQGYKKGDVSCMTYNQCQSGSTVELCTGEEMGHTWPSGSQYLSERLIGPVNKNISTDQIWDFFKKHTL